LQRSARFLHRLSYLTHWIGACCGALYYAILQTHTWCGRHSFDAALRSSGYIIRMVCYTRHALGASRKGKSGAIQTQVEEQPMDEPRASIERRVERTVTAAVGRHGMWKPGERVVVAVSGGADSLCLLGTLLALRAQGASPPGEI